MNVFSDGFKLLYDVHMTGIKGSLICRVMNAHVTEQKEFKLSHVTR